MATALTLLLIACLLQSAQCGEFKVFMQQTINVSSGSCVTIPCSFDVEDRFTSNLDETCKAMWRNEQDVDVFDSSNPQSPIKGNLIGDLTKKDCTTTLYNMKPEDSKKYYLRVECNNPMKYGFKEQKVEISVTDQVTPTLTPSTLEVNDGTSVTLTCSAPARCLSHPPTLTWTPGLGVTQETLWENQDKTKVKISLLTFTATQRHHGQEISCTAVYNQQDGSTESSVSRLTADVSYPPQNTTVSVSPSGPVPEDSTVTLTCSSTANPAVRDYTWYTAQGGQETVMGTGHVLHIQASKVSVPFFCKAENDLGAGRSNINQIHVQYPPKHTTVSVSPSGPVPEDSTVTLICFSAANPAVRDYTWYTSQGGQETVIGTGHVLHIQASEILPSSDCTQTADQLICSCETVGNPAPTLQWYLDGLPVNHSDKFAISIAPQILPSSDCTQTADQLICSCETVGNPAPTLQWYLDGLPVNHSDKFAISIAPQILPSSDCTQTADQLICSCETVGNPAPTLQWYLDGLPVNHSDKFAISIAPQILPSSDCTQTADQLICSCETVGNPAPTLQWYLDGLPVNHSDKFAISIAPQILPSSDCTQTADQLICSCETVGNPAPTLQWYLDGLPVNHSDKFAVSNESLNDTGLRIIITVNQPQWRDLSTLLCRSSNSLGSVTQRFHVYSLESPTSAESHVAPQILPSSDCTQTADQLICSCETVGNPAPTLQWYLDGLPVNHSDKFAVSIVPKILPSSDCTQTADQLICSCETVGNPAPTLQWYLDGLPVNHSDKFAISIAPQILPSSDCTQTADQLICSCETVGNPAPTLQWYLDGLPVNHSDKFAVSNESLNNTVVPKILPSSDCTQTADQLICSCETVGNPAPTLQWYLDGLPVNHSDKFAVSSESLNDTGLRIIITVNQPQWRDLSTLLCRSSNSLGSVTQQFHFYSFESPTSAESHDSVMLTVFITTVVALLLIVCALLLVIRIQKIRRNRESTFAMNQLLTSNVENEETLRENPDKTKVKISLLTFTATQHHHGQEISCTAVYNKQDGSTVSSVSRLTADVSFAPQILPSSDCTQTADQLICSCETVGNPAPTLQWYLDGLPVSHSDKFAISNQVTPTLTPSKLEVDDGTSVTLTCSAPAPCPSHPPTLTWTPGLGVTQETLREYQDKTKVKISLLTFTATQHHHGQEISCTAVYNKQDGSTESSVSRLTADVSFAPQILPSSDCTQTADQLNCSCETVGNPAPTLQWYLDGLPVNHSDKFAISNTKMATALTLLIVACLLQTPCSSHPPTLTWTPVLGVTQETLQENPDKTKVKTSVLTFFATQRHHGQEISCTAVYNQQDGSTESSVSRLTADVSSPCPSHPPTLTWTPGLGVTQETLQENQDKTKVKTSVLTFTASQRHHGQEISCTAVYNQQDGSTESSVSRLTADVSFAPQILPSSDCTQTADQLICSCETVGNPAPTLQWYLDGLPVNHSDKFAISNTKMATALTLLIVACLLQTPCPSHPPTLTWTPVLGVTQETLREYQDKTKVKTSVLTFTATQRHHGQEISCTAVYNKQDGSTESSVSRLTADVSFVPKILPSSDCTKTADQLNCSCETVGNPAPTLQWYLDGLPVNHSDKFAISNSVMLIVFITTVVALLVLVCALLLVIRAQKIHHNALKSIVAMSQLETTTAGEGNEVPNTEAEDSIYANTSRPTSANLPNSGANNEEGPTESSEKKNEEGANVIYSSVNWKTKSKKKRESTVDMDQPGGSYLEEERCMVEVTRKNILSNALEVGSLYDNMGPRNVNKEAECEYAQVTFKNKSDRHK
ncbi:Sialic acid-binding Ig-like lectin 7 [Larimichthys crocea]|uniref:Sialic acid-binding Ig-like lectin 7 n=1 Tax=Larimichthys crocea TaxID=215358 RepID=A0A6G0ID03_LARCR|nr:Sialic acid-binding Ig-like lectin 7 [Larimichthys crocea]